MNKTKTVSFDHTKPVVERRFKRMKYLEQGGQLFTYAEYNKFTKKWEPEPKPLRERDIYREVFSDQLAALNKKLNAVDEELKDMIALLGHLANMEEKGYGKAK